MGKKRGAAHVRFYTKSNKIFITLITLNCILVVHHLTKTNKHGYHTKKSGSLRKCCPWPVSFKAILCINQKRKAQVESGLN